MNHSTNAPEIPQEQIAERPQRKAFRTTLLLKAHVDRIARLVNSADPAEAKQGSPGQGGRLPKAPRQASLQAEERWAVLAEYEPWNSVDPATRARHLEVLSRQGETDVCILPRDSLMQNSARSVVVVLSGQVVVALMERSALDAAQKRQSKEQQGKPATDEVILSRQVAHNIAYYEAGAVFSLQWMISELQSTIQAHPDCALMMYTITNSAIFCLSSIDFQDLYSGQDTVSRYIHEVSSKCFQNLPLRSGISADANDFFIRHGLSISETIRMQDLSKCINCGACEKACSDLYGRNRLHLSMGVNFHDLNVLGTCRTCEDQRCVTSCAYSAIQFDPKRQEIIIDEFACVGCSACSTACPYQAIEMRPLHAGSVFSEKVRLRLKVINAEEQARQSPTKTVADLKRSHLASKCDHCRTEGHPQACIQACPGGPATLSEYTKPEALAALNRQAQRSRTSRLHSTPGGPTLLRKNPSARYLRPLWLAVLCLFAVGFSEFFLQRSRLVVGVRSLQDLLGLGPWLSSHDVQLFFGWATVVSMSLATLLGLRRVLVARKRPPGVAPSWLHSVVHKHVGEVSVHTLFGVGAGLLALVHAWWPWRSMLGACAALSMALLVGSGWMIRGASGWLLRQHATAQTQLKALQADWERVPDPTGMKPPYVTFMEQVVSQYQAAVQHGKHPLFIAWAFIYTFFTQSHLKSQLITITPSDSVNYSLIDLAFLQISCQRAAIFLPQLSVAISLARYYHAPFTFLLIVFTCLHALQKMGIL